MAREKDDGRSPALLNPKTKRAYRTKLQTSARGGKATFFRDVLESSCSNYAKLKTEICRVLAEIRDGGIEVYDVCVGDYVELGQAEKLVLEKAVSESS